LVEESEELKQTHSKELELIYIASFENTKKHSDSFCIKDLVKVSSGGKPSTKKLWRQDTPIKGYNDLQECPGSFVGLRINDSVIDENQEVPNLDLSVVTTDNY
jgi:hypothetical protein